MEGKREIEREIKKQQQQQKKGYSYNPLAAGPLTYAPLIHEEVMWISCGEIALVISCLADEKEEDGKSNDTHHGEVDDVDPVLGCPGGGLISHV